MEHARAHGYPVPAARVLSDTDIVMERVHGPTMLDDLARRPWSLASHAGTLARLHKQLHEIAAPAWLPAPLGEGSSLLHLDLHPDNVILGPRGPVVIDWPNAARGPYAADVAHTWIVMACSVPTTRALPAGGHPGRRPAVRGALPAPLRPRADHPAAGRGGYVAGRAPEPASRRAGGDPADGGGGRIGRAERQRRLRTLGEGGASRYSCRPRTRKRPVLASGALSCHGGSPSQL